MGDYEPIFDPILGKTRAKDLFTGSGLLSINGLTPVAQLLAVASAGSDFNIVSSGATHTFNLPTASALNRGALSSTDWSTFNNKLSNISGQDHSTLNNLDYASAGHTGFEKSLTFSTGLTRSVDTITTNDSQIVHDNLSGFVADEHIDHSGVNINAGGILSGGGNITTSRTITLNQSDVDHDLITNTHNLTTDIDHDQLLNYVAGEHFLQSAITQISAGVGDGLVKSTSGTLSAITDNSTNWNTAYGWGDHALAGYLKNIVEDTTPQLGGDLDTNSNDIKFLDNDKAIFGTGLDFEIYHDTNNTIFRNLLQDKNTIFYVNKGGVDTQVLKAFGSTGNVRVEKLLIGTDYDTSGIDLHINANGVNADFWVGTYSNNAADSSRGQYYRGRGTSTAITPVQSGDELSRMVMGGYYANSSDILTNFTGAIQIIGATTENWSATNKGVSLTIRGVNTGSASLVEWFKLQSGGLTLPLLKTGATAAGAGASSKELWVTSGHATLPDGVVMQAP